MKARKSDDLWAAAGDKAAQSLSFEHPARFFLSGAEREAFQLLHQTDSQEAGS